MNNLNNKVVVVTGGSKGFGLAIAAELLEQNAKVALISRSIESLQNAKESLINEKGFKDDHIFIQVADVSKSGDLEDAFEAVDKQFGQIDALVNNAGLAKVGHISELVEEEVKLQMDTNVLGTIFACKAALPYLKKSAANENNPRIVNISSASAYHHDEMAHLSIYAASKAAVERYTRDLRRELENDLIGVTMLRPGAALDTEFGFGLDFEKLKTALEVWQEQGPYSYEGMASEHIAEAVSYCLQSPPGVSVDLMEVRPNKKTKKPLFS